MRPQRMTRTPSKYDDYEPGSDESREPNLKRKMKKVDDGEKPKKTPRVAAAPADTGPDPPPDLPESFKERIQRLGGRNPVLVIQKRLFSTDVSKQQNRLSIPLSSLKTEFLEDGERELLDIRLPNRRCEALKPRILDAKGGERIILLKKWEMKKDNGSPSCITYNLCTPWYEMVEANGWEAGLSYCQARRKLTRSRCSVIVHSDG